MSSSRPVRLIPFAASLLLVVASCEASHIMQADATSNSTPNTGRYAVVALASGIQPLQDAILALRASGILNEGQATALLQKLTNIERQFDAGKAASALAQVEALIQQIEDFVADGVLTPVQGQSLLDEAAVLREIIAPTGILLSNQETIFSFDLTSHVLPPPYNAISFAAIFSVGDPVTGTDVLITNVYGDANGAQLVQVRNDTGFITAGGTVYGPLTTANPIFDPMLDGIFSFGLTMTSGTAVLKEFRVCGVIFFPYQETCETIS